MNSNPYTVPAIVLGAVMIIACITGLVIASYARRPGAGKHARHPEPVPFADSADRDDPDGAGYVGQLIEPPAGEPDWLDEDELDAGWWAQHAPPSRVEILTGPAARIAATSELTVNVVDRALGALPHRQAQPPAGPHRARSAFPLADLGRLAAALRAWNPGSSGSVTETRPQPALIAWDGKTARQLTDELAAKYLAAPQ